MLGVVLSARAQLNITTANIPVLIDFDATFAGVNEGQFAGAGVDPSPATGQLDADAWELIGMSDADYLFGSSANSGDAARGQSAGGVSTGGLYAFDVTGSGNYALGFQPAGSDFTPGSITLMTINNSGGYVAGFDIQYSVLINNNEDRANDVTFSYSFDNVDYIEIPALDVVSAELEGAPGFFPNFVAYTELGLVMADTDTIYFRWTSDDVSGGGSRDEIALDDISITLQSMEPTVIVEDAYLIEDEDGGTVNIDMSLIANNGSPSTVKVYALNQSTANNLDYSMPTGITFPGTADETLTFTITLNNDTDAERTEYIALMVGDSTNGVAYSEENMIMIYINDDDFTPPTANNSITLEHIYSYAVDSGSAEISAYDSTSMRLYVANSTHNLIDIVDLSDPYNPTLISTINADTMGNINSVAVYNGLVAVAVADSIDVTLDGSVVFYDGSGLYINHVTAGANPDMVVFTPDHQAVLSANEGEPATDYLTDPEGTITIIDISSGAASATTTQVNFNAFDAQASTLMSAGVRIFGPGSSVSEDLEPEYITFNQSGTTAYITCQENNAIAVLDMGTETITDILPLGVKDYSQPGNALDISNESPEILIANWPVYGYYLPDAIASYQVGGNTYLVTANEGDAREYDALEEEDRLKNLDLDDATFGEFENFLVMDENAGRVKITLPFGDTEGDTDYDSVFVFGGRSFSIWDDAGNLVYDSGDDFEQITAADPTFGAIFNCSNDNNDLKDRSDDKGPEPEGVVTGVINDTVYAFITLERVGGIMVYDVTNPASPNFVQYINTRVVDSLGGDLAPEGIIFVSAEASPIDTALLVVSNEVSGTVSIFKINQWYDPGVGMAENKASDLLVYPNPAMNTIFFNETINAQIIDITGKVVLNGVQVNKMDISALNDGLYIIKTDEGQLVKLIKE